MSSSSGDEQQHTDSEDIIRRVPLQYDGAMVRRVFWQVYNEDPPPLWKRPWLWWKFRHSRRFLKHSLECQRRLSELARHFTFGALLEEMKKEVERQQQHNDN